jgi:hypothetical protein
MSYLQQVEQTTASAAGASNQFIYPKAGAYARMDSTGVEKSFLDSATYAAATSIMNMQTIFGGL